ncbi:ATP-binding cassette domain-containing protein [Aquimarina muelleri]|uniref:ABC transporter ATP-binding protein n=1 Tax=Aquimarina muelleri TaxID=279356 RepID=A0A918K0G7_9FLAO|nr:ATP-binding cassette domain-containing protein [Aquimarina muelleri]MCX2763665.1 ATP-binding cassette domain-containing protein [Aquimarina muelleri]GGX30168.1 ABC transporter ATP-binding protein [Aquimarina muelleri]
MDVLEITNLNKSYGKKILLKNINLQCKVGEIIGAFGRNGTGKSTLLKLIFGTVKADSIHIKINSKTIFPNDIISSKKIAYLPQDTFLPKEQKVREIIPLFFPNGEDQDKIFYSPQVSSFEKTKVGKLSLGQLRYLELLIIGNLSHTFLMLDEPFSMIEPIYKDVIKDLLLKLKKSKGIILTDHYYNDVFEITNKNFIIRDAKKIEIVDKADLIKYEYLKSNQ